MRPFNEMDYHPLSEQLVGVLRDHTQRDDSLFFRLLVGYYFCLAASQMRCTIVTPDRGNIPTNMYVLSMAPSGYGKTMSMNLLEEQVLGQFRHRFLQETYPILVEQNLPKIAVKRAARKGTDPDDELLQVKKAFERMGPLLFSFAAGSTAPAIKQMRNQLLMANAGSLNLIIDEIGDHLSSSQELFVPFIEMFDKGLLKQSLLKNTAENARDEEIVGNTPANLLMYGVPNKLFDGAKTEQDLIGMLEAGYARRCFFGYIRRSARRKLTAAEMYDVRTSRQNNAFVEALSDRLEALADIINANKKLVISRDTSILLYEYQLDCEARADQLPEHQEVQKRELSERNFKALKLAGAYAFIDDSPEVTPEHIYNAIRLAEDAGDAFAQMMTRDRPFVKLAKYIAVMKNDVTQADMVEDLPFYRGSGSAKQEMLTQAIAWGYKNNIIIKRTVSDGIEFLRGETLSETDLNRMVVAYSSDITTDYVGEYAPFDQLHKLTQAAGMHWVSHHLTNGYRNEESCIPGFNLAVVDVDGGVNMSTARLLLKGYKYLLYTTKRHTEDEHRFRIVFPMNYTLALDAKDYKEFMTALYQWLPFEVDTTTNQRSRKWLSNAGHYEYNDGELIDVLPFIPKTSKNEARKALMDSQQSMDNLERWMINNIGDGNRNNMLLRFAMILVDAGFDFEGVRSRVMSLNDKIPDKLDEIEVMNTVMVTTARALAKRGSV